MNEDRLPSRQAMKNPRQRRCKKHTSAKRKGIEKIEHKPSYIEVKVSDYIRSKGIRVINEKEFYGCRSMLNPDKLLPFDIYLPDLRACIELNGKQHYSAMDDDRDEFDLDRRKLNDNTRKLFCMKKGIPLLIIKYDSFKQYRSIIDQFIDGILMK